MKWRPPTADERCPACSVRIREAGGEAPTAVFIEKRNIWVCSNCYDSGRWPKEPVHREAFTARNLADAAATAFRVYDLGGQLDAFGADIVEIRRREGMDGPHWAICLRGFCLNGETLAWDWEPQPSSRDEAYLRLDAIPFGDG